MRHRHLLIGCFAAAALAAPSAAQTVDGPYRAGQPDVLTPPPSQNAARDDAPGAFRAAYAKAGRPRIMVLWNREFSDDVTTAYEDRVTIEKSGSAHAMASRHTAGSRYGNTVTGEVEAEANSRTDVVSATDRATDKRRNSKLTEAADWAVEDSFSEALISAGVRMSDRNMAMRTSKGAKTASERPNMQAIEAEAAENRAEYIVEVLQTDARNGSIGVAFRVVVKDLRTSRLIASFTTKARPPAKRMPFVAGPNGYERAAQPEVSPDDTGRQLAAETMVALSRGM